MIFRHSLRFRIVTSFCLFGAVLGTVYAAAVYFSLDRIDDKLVNTRLEQEIDHFSAQYRKNNDSPIPTSPHIIGYLSMAAMPSAMKNLVRGMAEGFHEVYIGEEEYHIAIKKLPYHDEPLYLIYEVSALEFTNKRKGMIGIVLVAGVILLIGLGLWIGLLTSRKVIAPVVHLADQVNLSDPDDIPTDLSKNFYNDEVGMLAKVLEQSMQRIKAFVEREKQFNRDASHELRTPVTVIKGAMELLQNRKPETGIGHSPIKRIERAVTDMENIIESLLWLAREEAPIDFDQFCEAVPIVKEVVEQYQHLLKDKPVEIEYFAEANPTLSAPPPILKIVIINLLQNAFHHTIEGKIKIHVHNDRISVKDTGEGIETKDLETITQPHVRGNSSPGFGLGLAIVKRLCQRFGWFLDIESEVGKGTSVHLLFKLSEK